jgi:hypothetical protein
MRAAISRAISLPGPVAATAGAVLRIQILLGVAAAQVLAVHKSLTVLHHRQVDVDLTDHLRHQPAVAIGGLLVQPHRAAHRQPLLEVLPRLQAIGALARFGGS